MVRIVTIFAMIASTANAFSGSSFTGASSRVAFGVSSSPSRLSMAVVDIDSEAKFDKTIESAGDSLVVVDYSTTWCGPCKVIAPKFDELSEQYSDAVFVKVSPHQSSYPSITTRNFMCCHLISP
uniref:Thioredoxin domain-containing protein n=1 Tax=Ditylum brightwellii TaxID=49249 RepID=A0A6V2AAC3_9STRA|eukprot:14775119-Ditylum_brightwellii.AAC.1